MTSIMLGSTATKMDTNVKGNLPYNLVITSSLISLSLYCNQLFYICEVIHTVNDLMLFENIGCCIKGKEVIRGQVHTSSIIIFTYKCQQSKQQSIQVVVNTVLKFSHSCPFQECNQDKIYCYYCHYYYSLIIIIIIINHHHHYFFIIILFTLFFTQIFFSPQVLIGLEISGLDFIIIF